LRRGRYDPRLRQRAGELLIAAQQQQGERVVIVGGGPTGYATALFLTAQDVPVTLIERDATPYRDPRAATFHPPTLELLAASGVTDELHRRGIIARRWQFRDRQAGLVAEFDLAVLAQDTPFPYRLQCEQHKLVQILAAKLADEPRLEVLTDCEVSDAVQSADAVVLSLRRGAEALTLSAPYVIGADGGRSVVRKSQGIDFEGFTYPERFLVITTTFDYEPVGYAYSNYTADPQEWTASFKVPGDGPPGLWRVVFPCDPEAPEGQLLDFDHAQRQLQGLLPQDEPYDIVHTNLYQVHQRVAATYRRGRVLLAGDAAHVNNPLGGMGMNFGIHDGANLAEKLAQVWHGQAPASLLDRYDRQRRHVAEAYLQAMTIQNKQTLEEKDPEKRAARMADMRRIAADPVAMRKHLLNTAMIEGVRAAAAIE
jgi:3-(3-hydroxy-phenyl)propionate hydroxylase